KLIHGDHPMAARLRESSGVTRPQKFPQSRRRLVSIGVLDWPRHEPETGRAPPLDRDGRSDRQIAYNACHATVAFRPPTEPGAGNDKPVAPLAACPGGPIHERLVGLRDELARALASVSLRGGVVFRMLAPTLDQLAGEFDEVALRAHVPFGRAEQRRDA